MEWTRRTISDATRDWLAALPEHRVERDVTLVHGSPRDPIWEYVTSPDDRPGRHRGHDHDRSACTATPTSRSRSRPRTAASRCIAPGRRLVVRPRGPRALAQPGQRRPAARRRPAGELPGPGSRRRDRSTWHRVAYDIDGRPGGDARGRPAGPPRRAPAPWRLRRVAAVDRRSAAAPGPQARRPAGPGRAAARAVLPLHGPRHADGEGGGQRARRRRAGKAFAAVRGLFFGRPLASEEELGERLSRRRRRSRSSAPMRSARRPMRPRRSSRPDPRRRGRAGLRRPGQHRDLDPARRGGDLVSPDLHRLPDGRRLVHGLAAEHRSDGQPGRRVGAAHRLRHDRRGLDVVGRRADRLGVPGPVRRAGPHRGRGDRAHRRRQPARPARGREHLRRPDLPVHLLGACS